MPAVINTETVPDRRGTVAVADAVVAVTVHVTRTPRPMGPRPAGTPMQQPGSPTPSSGAPGRDGRPGIRDRDDKQSKKDREKEMLIEKARAKRGRSMDHTPAAPPAPRG